MRKKDGTNMMVMRISDFLLARTEENSGRGGKERRRTKEKGVDDA